MMEKIEGSFQEIEKNAEFVKWFSKIDKSLISLVGEKGAILGELFLNKLPVPNGFVVTSEAYRKFLISSGLESKIKILLANVNLDNSKEIEEISSKIKNLIENSEFPEEIKEEIIDSYTILGTNKIEIEKGSARDILNNASEPVFVSVRSSICFKNSEKIERREQDTYLNVKGNEAVLEHVKKAFVSLFNPLTLKREMRKKGFENFNIAVIVQKMIDSEKSGFAFSKDSSENINISAIWGIGEGFNLENISPDKYTLSRELEIIGRQIGEKTVFVIRDSSGSLKAIKSGVERKNSQVLSDYEIQRIGDFAEKIEVHLGSPQRIDFAIVNSEISILQSEEFQISKVKNKEDPVENSEVMKVEKISKTKIKLDLDSPFMIEDAEKTALKKIGILKIEKIIEKTGKHPLYFLEQNSLIQYENIIYDGIKSVAENFEEVWVRTNDLLNNHSLNLEGAPKIKEENPLLGMHGVRFGLKYLPILEAELKAIKRISGKIGVGILIPNLISIEELRKVKTILKKINFENVKIGVLIETPASMQLIKEFCNEKVNLIVVNSEVIAQNILSVDSSNQDVSIYLDYLHPSLVYQLEYLIRVAKRNNVETNIFGKGILEDKFLEYILRKEIDFISVPPEYAKKISEKVSFFESDLLKVKDSDPRKYELEKTKKEYLRGGQELKSFPEKKEKSTKNNDESVDILGIF